MLTPEQWNGQQTEPTQSTQKKQPAAKPSAPKAAAPKEEKGFIGTAIDIVKGGLSGAFKEAENVVQTGHDIADFVDNKFGSGDAIDDEKDYDFVPEVLKPETGLGKTAQAISAFATGWVTGGKLISTAGKTALAGTKAVTAMQKIATAAPKASKAVKVAAKGGVIDFITGDGSDERLANVLVENDIFRNAFTEYLAGDENDSALEGRFKNVLEGYVVGTALDTAVIAFKGIKKGYKASLKGSVDGSLAARKEAAETADNIAKAAKENPAVAAATPEVPAKKGKGKKGKKGAAQETAPVVDPNAPVTSLEEAKARFGDNWAKVGTPTAKAELRESIKHIKAKKLDFLNTEHYTDAAKAMLNEMQDEGKEIMSTKHMDMKVFGNKSLDYIFENKLDEVLDKGKLLTTEGLKDVDSRVGTMVQANWLNAFAPEHIRKAAQSASEGSPEALAATRKALEDTFDVSIDMRLSLREAGQRGKAADIVRIFGFGAGEKAETTATELSENVVANASSFLKDKTDEEILDIANSVIRNIENGDTKEVLKIAAGLAKDPKEAALTLGLDPATVRDTILKIRYSSMLSSMKTQIRNIAGNTAKIPLMVFEEGVKGAAMGFQAASGQGAGRRIVGALNGAKAGLYFMQGMYKAQEQAWSTFRNAMKYAEPLTRVSEYNQLTKIEGNKEWWAAPLRLLGACDEYFASLAGTAKAYETAMLELKASNILKGTTPELREKLTKQWLEDAMDNAFIPVTMSDGTVVKHGSLATKETLDAADEITFQQKLDAVNQSLSNTIQNSTALKILMPFYKTPVNIFKDAFVTRGVGLPKEMLEAFGSKDPERIATAVSHLTSACFIWSMAYELVQSGKITGQEQGTKLQASAKLANGIQPNSYIDNDGRYWSLNLLEPYGSMLGFLATAAEIADREGVELFSMDGTDVLFEGLMQTVVDKTFVKGLADVLLSIQRGNTAGTLSQIPISFIPGILRDLGQMTDPIKRAAPDFYSKAWNRTPLKDDLAPKIDWFTGMPEEYSHGGGIGAFLDAANISHEKFDAVFYELSRLSGSDEPSDTVAGVKLDPYQNAEYRRVIGTTEINGKTMYQTLEEIINSDAYQNDIINNPDPSPYELDPNRQDRLNKVIKAFKDRGKEIFIKENMLNQSSTPSPFAPITES